MINKLIYLKKASLLLLLAFLSNSDFGSAQYMEFEWSDEYRFTNRKTGFFTGFIGANQTSVYLLQQNIAKSRPYDKAKLMLVALNKNSLAPDTLRPIKGYPENEGNAQLLNSLDYLTSAVVGAQVVVFWRRLIITDSTRKEEIYGQTFKSDLKDGTKLTKVFVFEHKVDSRVSIFDPSMSVVLTHPESDQIVVGTERYKDGKAEFYYTLLGATLGTNKSGTIPLEGKPKAFPGTLTSTYEMGRNEVVYIRSSINYTDEELDSLPPKHATSYLALTAGKVGTPKHCTLKFYGENKTITDFNYQHVGEKTRVIGFFGDLGRDSTGIDRQGVFYADIDDNSLSKTAINYVYFEKSALNRLFPKKRLRKRQKEKISEEEQLQTRFDIEHIETMEDSSIVVFFNLEYNREVKSSRSNLNGENVYSTEYFFKKTEVNALRFSNEGEVLWAKSLERKANYQGTDVDDIHVVYKHGKFIVLFGNEDAELKPPKRGKKYRHLTEELEYATFDPNSGRAKTYTTEVNEPKTDKRDKRYLNPSSAVVIGDQFYFHKLRVRQNPLWTAANVVCFPTIYYSVLSGNTKLGKGDFTLMRVMKGKRPRKRR